MRTRRPPAILRRGENSGLSDEARRNNRPYLAAQIEHIRTHSSRRSVVHFVNCLQMTVKPTPSPERTAGRAPSGNPAPATRRFAWRFREAEVNATQVKAPSGIGLGCVERRCGSRVEPPAKVGLDDVGATRRVVEATRAALTAMSTVYTISRSRGRRGAWVFVDVARTNPFRSGGRRVSSDPHPEAGRSWRNIGEQAALVAIRTLIVEIATAEEDRTVGQDEGPAKRTQKSLSPKRRRVTA